MTSRDIVLGTIRRSLGVSATEPSRQAAVAERLRNHPRGLIPARGQLAPAERVALFRSMMAAAAGTTTQLTDAADIPKEIAALLRMNNLPPAVRIGADSRLAAIPWQNEPTLTVSTGPSDGNDLVAVSFAFAGVAESGTLVLNSGPDNPTTLNFLPDTHVVVVNADDIAGDYETVWERLRPRHDHGVLPRTVNLITGPSRSADIGQTLILGAHGPRRLHVIVLG